MRESHASRDPDRSPLPTAKNAWEFVRRWIHRGNRKKTAKQLSVCWSLSVCTVLSLCSGISSTETWGSLSGFFYPVKKGRVVVILMFLADFFFSQKVKHWGGRIDNEGRIRTRAEHTYARTADRIPKQQEYEGFFVVYACMHVKTL